MGKYVLGIVVGLISALVIIMAIESISHWLYPMPEGLDPSNPEAFSQWVETLSAGAFLIVLLAYAAGSFGGGFMATLLSRKRPLPAATIGVLLTCFGIFNLQAIPHPLWFAIVSTFVYVPFALFGSVSVRLEPTQPSITYPKVEERD